MPSWSNISSNESLTIEGVKEIDQGRDVQMGKQNNTKTKIPVDIAFDISTLMIIVPVVITNLILFVLSFRCSACEILITAVWYLGILAIFLQDRTEVELTHGMIIVHRHFLGPVIVNQKDITKTHYRKNTWHAYRWALHFLMVVFIGYLTYGAFYDIIIRFQTQAVPAGVLINHIFSSFLMPLLFIVLFFNLVIRLKRPFYLRVETNTGKFVFYPDRPDELERMINGNKTEMD